MKEKPTAAPARNSAGHFLPGHAVGAATRWRDRSGNPAGSPRARRAFEDSFYAALIGEGSAEEAAKLLWECARNKEPWAVQTLLARIAPQESRLKITPEAGNGNYDLTRLTAIELDTLIQLAERAFGGDVSAVPRIVEGRASAAEPENLR